MKTKALILLALLPTLAQAQNPQTPQTPQTPHSNVFDPVMAHNQNDCVSMDEIAALATDGVTTLNEAQFQTIRAIYIVIPPLSEVLPVGEFAFMAKSGSDYLFGLYGDGLLEGKPASNISCARFEPVGHLTEIIIQVGLGLKGEIPGKGL